MEAMMKSMLKSMGFNPDDMKKQIENAGIAFKSLADQLNRIEVKLDLLLNKETANAGEQHLLSHGDTNGE
jgi:hypothetical protein